MKTLDNKWIIYDGSCGLCINSKKLFTRLGVFPESKCLNYHTLEAPLYAKIDPEHFRYEMALVDEEANKTLYGLEGILAIFATQIGILANIRPGSWLFRLLDFLYHAISYNRLFLFPRRSLFACDCDPPFKMKYFIRWMGLSLLIAISISALLALVLAGIYQQTTFEMVPPVLLIVGTGWMFQFLLSGLLMQRNQMYDYWRHLGLIIVAGVLILLPSLALFWIPKDMLLVLLLINIAISSLIMLRMHWRRIRFMGLKQGWTLSWFLALQAFAFYFVFHFNLLQL